MNTCEYCGDDIKYKSRYFEGNCRKCDIEIIADMIKKVGKNESLTLELQVLGIYYSGDTSAAVDIVKEREAVEILKEYFNYTI